MASLVNLTSSNWSSEVVNSNDPVIVVCWADWSGPSKQLLPTISSLADSSTSSAKFAQLDAGTETSLASNLNLVSVPQVIALQKGQVQTRIMGAQSQSYYKQVLKV